MWWCFIIIIFFFYWWRKDPPSPPLPPRELLGPWASFPEILSTVLTPRIAAWFCQRFHLSSCPIISLGEPRKVGILESQISLWCSALTLAGRVWGENSRFPARKSSKMVICLLESHEPIWAITEQPGNNYSRVPLSTPEHMRLSDMLFQMPSFPEEESILPVSTQPWPSKTCADCEASSARIFLCPELFSSTRFYIYLLCWCKGTARHINFSGKVKPRSIISPFFMLVYSSEQVLLPNIVSRVENLKGWNNRNILGKKLCKNEREIC